MKKLFAIAVLGLVLASCKKSSSGAGSSVTATFNDTSFSFTQAFQGTIYNGGKEIDLYVTNSTNAATATQLRMELLSNTAITPGVYSDTATYPNNVTLPTVSKYAYFEVYPYIYPNTGIDHDFWTIGLTSNPFTVTVTSITQTSIQGTFSGKLYLDGDSTTTADSIRVITNGTFNAPLIIQN
jgi:hypothetical protein